MTHTRMFQEYPGSMVKLYFFFIQVKIIQVLDFDNWHPLKNVMSFRVTFVSNGQFYKPLAEKSFKGIPIDFKWEHRRILQIIVDADFGNTALFIFTRAKHMTLIVQEQRTWNVEFVTISPTHT